MGAPQITVVQIEPRARRIHRPAAASFGLVSASAMLVHLSGGYGAFVLAASLVSMTAWRFGEQQSLHDPLTGLPNRALFADRLDHAMAVAARTGRPLAVVTEDVVDKREPRDTV